MRTKQKHKCWACGYDTEHFVKVKRKVYFIKRFECLPKCLMAHDIERVEFKLINALSQSSPWLDIINHPHRFKITPMVRKAQE